MREAHREAVTLLEQALDALQHLPQSPETMSEALGLRSRLSSPLMALGDPDRMLDNLLQAEALAQALGDQPRLARVYSGMAYAFGSMGDPLRAVEAGERALAIVSASGDLATRVGANVQLSRAYYAMGDYPRSIERARHNIAALQGDLIYERFGSPFGALTSLASRVWLVLCLAERGEFPEGTTWGEETIRIGEQVERANDLVWAAYGVGHLYLVKGDLEKAIFILERGLRLCQEGELPVYFPRIASSLGLAYALSGRISEAVPLLEQALEQAVSLKFMFGRSLVVAHLGEGYLMSGRFDDAARSGRQALELALAHKARGNQAWAHRLLGEIASRRDPPQLEHAEDHYRQAMALAEELGMRPLLAHCHQGLGRLSQRAGDRAKANEHLATAAGLFRSMEMRFWLERAEAELNGVTAHRQQGD